MAIIEFLIDYLDQLTFDYTQLCQRDNGSVYGIASGKQCRKGKPISFNPNDLKLGVKPGLKQVRVKDKDKVKNIVAKAKAIGLNNKEIRQIKEEVKQELNAKRVKGKEALKLFAKKANKLAKEKKANTTKPIKPDTPKPKPKSDTTKPVKPNTPKPKPKPKPKPVEPNTPKPKPKLKDKDKEGFPDQKNLSKLEFVRNLGGSTGAKLVRDPDTGKQYVLKTGKNTSDDHLTNEFAADEAYRALGLNVPKGKLYDTGNGKVKLTEYIEGGRSLGQLSGKEREDAIKEIRKGFATDAIMGNWDVVGAMQDNVLVDKNGKVWRIDNGGALEFRAKGDKKEGDQWNEYPTELWSMRRSSQGKEIFGDMDHDQIMSQIRNWKQSDIDSMVGKLPQSVQATMRRRIEEAQRVANISKTMRSDQFKAEYVDSFIEQSMALRNSGLIDKLSTKFTPFANPYIPNPVKVPYKLEDENGNLFDKLRGSDSLVKDWGDYVKSIGGDPQMIHDFAKSQGVGSWFKTSLAYKLWFARQQNYPEDSYLWINGSKTNAENSLAEIRAKWGEDAINKTMTAFHAFTYEQLQRYDMPNNNRQNGTIGMIRSVKKKHLPSGASIGDSGLNINQGILESYSMFSSFYFKGTELIAQEIPHHRVFGIYLNNRPESGSTTGLFATDDENEALVLQRGISAKYIGNSNTHFSYDAVDVFHELNS